MIQTVGTPKAEWLSLLPVWRRSRAILGGLATAKQHDKVVHRDNLLVPFSPVMTQAQYDFLKSEAELPCITAQFAKILIESLLRKRPVLDIDGRGELNDWLLDNFGQDDSAVEATISAAAQEELATGGCWIFVDAPSLTPQQIDAMTPQELEGVKPYPVIRRAEEVINWHYDTDSRGRRQLVFVLVRTFESTFEESNIHPVIRDVVWEHRLDGKGDYVVIKHVGQVINSPEIEGGTQKPPASGTHAQVAYTSQPPIHIRIGGETMKYIPAWPLSGETILEEPPLMPIVEKEIALYNKMTRRNHLLYTASSYTPWVSGSLNPEEFDNIVSRGLGSWLQLPEGTEIGVLATPTEALKDYDRAIADAISEIARLGVRMLAAEVAQSGIALEIRNAAQTAQLGRLNTDISNTMRKVIACMVHWYTGEEPPLSDVKFSLNSDFLAAGREHNELRLITEWYENGHISRSVFIDILRESDYLPDGYNDEDAKRELDNASQIIPPLED